MKNHVYKVLALLTIVSATSKMHAWSYTFSNHTDKEIGIAMKYWGLGEPRYFRFIPQHSQRQFTPNQAMPAGTPGAVLPIEGRKIGFVLKDLWYVTDAEIAAQPNCKLDRENAKMLPWHALTITWMPTEANEIAMKLYKASMGVAGQAAAVAAQVGALTADAVATGGLSTTALAAVKGISATSSNAEVKSALHKFISAIGDMAGRSMITDRHIDIIEDEGVLKFISHL